MKLEMNDEAKGDGRAINAIMAQEFHFIGL